MEAVADTVQKLQPPVRGTCSKDNEGSYVAAAGFIRTIKVLIEHPCALGLPQYPH